MVQKQDSLILNRVMLALDASPLSSMAIMQSVDLASRLLAELVVVCVEDINLIQLARSPFARTISSFSKGAKPLDKEAIGRMIRLQVEEAKETLALAVGNKPIKNSLLVRQGKVEKEVVEASKDTDLLIIGCSSGWGAPDKLRSEQENKPNAEISQRGHYILEHSESPVLVLRSSIGEDIPLIVPFDGSINSEKALNAAADFVSRISEEKQVLENTADVKTRVAVLLISQSPEEAMQLREKATQILDSDNISGSYTAVPKTADIETMTRTLIRTINNFSGGVIVLEKESLLLGNVRPCEFPRELLNELYGSILQVC